MLCAFRSYSQLSTLRSKIKKQHTIPDLFIYWLKAGSEAQFEEIEAEIKCKLERLAWLQGIFSLAPDSKIMYLIFVLLLAAASNRNRNRNTKPNSVICGDCDGNGAVQCSQCKGNGVNSVDLFNGRFKAGDSCWLCGGKKDMNGAGFIGGFMRTFDE
ncbi:hypothetical protein Ddye_007106 [Dipteronia dyeriana]|uniref:BSD2 cysteine rich domain-containing protein n=1 Tax=Dipteronia dyeriana TaxID=168575 RepID=A0AAD9XJQ0_9ROSI|nr:hypothetical protein Ddye_007106 [Dipteronia dyeriana]